MRYGDIANANSRPECKNVDIGRKAGFDYGIGTTAQLVSVNIRAEPARNDVIAFRTVQPVVMYGSDKIIIVARARNVATGVLRKHSTCKQVIAAETSGLEREFLEPAMLAECHAAYIETSLIGISSNHQGEFGTGRARYQLCVLLGDTHAELDLIVVAF